MPLAVESAENQQQQQQQQIYALAQSQLRAPA